MRGSARTVIGTSLFFLIAPGTVAGWIPYALTRWRIQPPLLGWSAVRVVGGLVVALGAAGLIECFRRFVVEGRGTPAPIAPPEELVVSGLYRHVRNPMYVAVVAAIVGQALFFGAIRLLGYAVAVWLVFHAFVVLYEEPKLRQMFGGEYDAYRANVPRWWPRVTSWQRTA